MIASLSKMKKLAVILSLISGTSLLAREIPNFVKGASGNLGNRVLANCSAPNASSELWINNVRTIIFSGGDMWWDRNGNGQAFYYLPAVQNKANGVSSSFAGSIWLGGLDAGGQLKIAAMTYRQNGIDFWPGPLDTINASSDAATCAKYDQIYKVSRTAVDAYWASGGNTLSSEIINWPGTGDMSQRQGRRLAPFVDNNGDGVYEPGPTSKDYPAYDIENKAEKDNLGFCKTKLFGDNTLFWVFNDNSGIHTETQGVPIGVEVRAQAFGFKTNDEINNMTFYSYEVFNRSSFQLNKTYFTIWNDADLGYFLDDYVGCDVKRGLGYIYNADPFDETAMGTNGYQDFPPALGCDFFKGPLADINDGIDNDQDDGTGLPNSGMDEPGETIQMSRFTYYNNNYGAFPPQTTNPAIAIHFYNYMTGFWKDGSPFTQGGNAYGGTTPAVFVYDGDPVGGTGWTEKGSGNPPGDRRFLQSAGPFTLKPGAVNEITFGMPWAQSPNKGGYLQSLELLKNADDKAQALFDNCFKLLDGPEAPVMTVQELDKELVIYLTNEKGKNNYRKYNNDYAEEDISIASDKASSIPALQNPDKFYRFEGYLVYQVLNNQVTANDLSDPTKAKIVFQCDIANGVSRLVNYETNATLGDLVPNVKVEGEDKGIRNTFRLREDAFSTIEGRRLVNNKTYYFIAVAYAYNQYLPYKRDVSPAEDPNQNSKGQKRPYLEGRKFKKAAGIPHNTDAEKEGTITQSTYGFGPKISRIEGQGNGGNLLVLTRESEAAILNAPGFIKTDVTYENAFGPVTVKVVDPLNVKNSNFTFRFVNYEMKNSVATLSANLMMAASGTNAVNSFTGTLGTLNMKTTSWELKDLNADKIYRPNEPTPLKDATDIYYQPIALGGEFYFPELGFSLSVKQVGDPGETANQVTNFATIAAEPSYTVPAGSFLGASQVYEGGKQGWLGSVPDIDGESPFNWILSGGNTTSNLEDAYYRKNSDGKVVAFYDPLKQFGKILGGTWAPYPLCASYYSLTPSSVSNRPSRIFCGPAFSGAAWASDELLRTTYGGQSTTSFPDRNNTDLRKMSSALIVFTRDKSKWTRCVVLEMQERSQLSEGNALYWAPRAHASVDKDGKSATGTVASTNPNEANFISSTGMGWFPGYAINLETGERLNMAFGEDSYQKVNNGNDMIWNPTSSYNAPYPYAMGGKHFVYVFGGSTVRTNFYQQSNVSTPYEWEAGLAGKAGYVGRYDYGERLITILKNFHKEEVYKKTLNGGALAPINAVERDIMWVSIPMPSAGNEFTDPSEMPSDVRFQINVSKPYRYGLAGVSDIPEGTQPYASFNKLTAVNHPSLVTADVAAKPQNDNFPMYSFNTSDIAALFDNADVAKNALDLIRVVPNPYYGASTYENNRTDNRVRITNLPNKCTVKIFTMNGTLVRTLKRDVSGQEDLYVNTSGSGDETRQASRVSYLEWDLKNQNNISIASGLYILHIDAPGIGEKIVKWFGVMRPLDVQSY